MSPPSRQVAESVTMSSRSRRDRWQDGRGTRVALAWTCRSVGDRARDAPPSHFHLRHGRGAVDPRQAWRAAGHQLLRPKGREDDELVRVHMCGADAHFALPTSSGSGSACGVQPSGIAQRCRHALHSCHVNELPARAARITLVCPSQRGQGVGGWLSGVGRLAWAERMGSSAMPW